MDARHRRNNYDCILYTDGGFYPNEKVGAYSFVFIDPISKIYASCVSEIFYDTTNNIMEMYGILYGLVHVLRLGFSKILVKSDSKYCIDNINSSIYNWIRNNWTTSQNTPVKNKEVWEILFILVNKAYVEFEWVKGHSGQKYNELCDSNVRGVMQGWKQTNGLPYKGGSLQYSNPNLGIPQNMLNEIVLDWGITIH